jgi:hypothetical protein
MCGETTGPALKFPALQLDIRGHKDRVQPMQQHVVQLIQCRRHLGVTSQLGSVRATHFCAGWRIEATVSSTALRVDSARSFGVCLSDATMQVPSFTD